MITYTLEYRCHQLVRQFFGAMRYLDWWAGHSPRFSTLMALQLTYWAYRAFSNGDYILGTFDGIVALLNGLVAYRHWYIKKRDPILWQKDNTYYR